MFRFFKFLLVPAVFASLSAGAMTATAPAVACCEIVLNEILADPARDWDGNGALSSRDDEWVEIYNPGPVTADLTGYRLAGPDSVWRYEFSGTIGPNQVVVVYGKQSADWETSHGFPVFGLRLSNTGGEVDLFKTGPGFTTKIDSYVYKDHEADDDRSSGRGPDGGPNWILLDGLFPWAGTTLPLGTNCLPSPGTKMSCPTPTLPVTWSTIKTMER